MNKNSNEKKTSIPFPYAVTPCKWARETVLTAATGISSNAVAKYRKQFWTYGHHFKHDPARVLVYNLEAISVWLES